MNVIRDLSMTFVKCIHTTLNVEPHVQIDDIQNVNHTLTTDEANTGNLQKCWLMVTVQD